MRAVLQRVTSASVRVDTETVGGIGGGLVVLLGIARSDTPADAEYLLDKIINLRVLDDDGGKMNLSVLETGASLLIVSQFTLYGDVRRGRRPSWIEAAPPEMAEPLYSFFVSEARKRVAHVATGSFRSMMQVELVNDGPVTMIIDSKKLF